MNNFENLIAEKESIKEETIEILGMKIETDNRKHDRIPSLDSERLQRYTEDDYAKKLEKKVLESVVMNAPLLLEGDPAVGKNATIEYLAALTNRPLYRVSLNGQTDVGNLIGKWVPKNKALEQQLYDKIKNVTSLSEESKKILSKYLKPSEKIENEENGDNSKSNIMVRESLSKEDIMAIAEIEDMEISDENWMWQDSEIVKAIEEGAWLVLDEVNTAEPQILVRLNSLLEKGGEMILSENSNRKTKRDPKFRVFGTMNPPGGRIKGRVQLSEDYVSRWRFVSVENMTPEDYLKRLTISEGLVDNSRSEMKYIESINEQKSKTKFNKLTDVYEDEWVKNFLAKYATFYFKLKKMVGSDINTSSGQEQNINYDHRDTDRFMSYILTFALDDFNQTINGAIELFSEKLKFEQDRKKVKVLAKDIIKLGEPSLKLTKEKNLDDEEMLEVFADLLNSEQVPTDHKDLLRKSITDNN